MLATKGGKAMRKVTKQIREAFMNGNTQTVGNTHTDGNSVWLFGNKIITKQDGKIIWTMAGYPTKTTQERLNGILGLRIYQKNFTMMLDDKNVDDSLWYYL